jgi:adenylosuccinate lyase
MPWKRNPLTFENIVGMADNAWREFMGVFKIFRSEHQRDLRGSSMMRQLQAVVVYLAQQIDTLLRLGDQNRLPFILRIAVDEQACRRNFAMSQDVIMAQACYMALVQADYPEDPHTLMNHTIVPLVREGGLTLTAAVEKVAESNPALRAAWAQVPAGMKKRLDQPEKYTGIARQRTRRIVRMARKLVQDTCAKHQIELTTK